MATIPTLIVAPAIIAAGIAYKYSGGEGSDARNIGPASAMRRRRSEMDTVGERFEQDYRMPARLAGTFIPTSVLRGGTALQAQAAGSSGDQGSLSSRMTLYGMSGGPTELTPDHTGRYPRTTDEIEHTSWLQRAARSITGDLGPIEHQERVVNIQHAGESQHPAEQADHAPRYFVRESVDNTRDRSAQEVERAVDEARGWYQSKKKEIDDDINQAASDAVSSTKQAYDETQGWYRSKKKEVDAAAASAVDDVKQMANEVSESTQDAANKSREWYQSKKKEVDEDISQAYDETQGWFWAKKKEVDDAAASAVDDVKHMASEVSESTKDAAEKSREWFQSKKKEVDEDISQAYDETQGWFWAKKQEADNAVADVADDIKRRASDMSDAARQSANEARDKLASKKQEAEEATAAAARGIRRRASDTSESAKQTADSTWSWLWSKKKEVDDTAANALDSAKDQAQSASDWVAAKKQSADNAASDAVDTARDTADSARDWLKDTKDDVSNSVGRADDVSRAWLWNAKGQVDQAIANTASAVQQEAESASNSAMESADAAARSYWQRGLGTAANAGWRPSAETIVDTPRESSDESQKKRRDSLLSGIDDNSVIQALDEKFNEARSMLKSTTEEIRTMASDASSAASETLRTAAEMTLPRPSSDGINMKEPEDDGHRDMRNQSDAQARFVEVNSHIPLLSSSPHKRT
ncbi:hypothetical protein IW146_009522 [Coemansia sp. RSA 922]|nr:hypothetical protein IW146_009522 [Coemansia sp. RSA 922]KAJ2343712.1 hypothetical protein GGH92_004794 [Coemansia sp. RSA 2673]